MDGVENTRENLWLTAMCDYLLSYINLTDTKKKNVLSKDSLYLLKYNTVDSLFQEKDRYCSRSHNKSSKCC